jgi:hypothetical protein
MKLMSVATLLVLGALASGSAFAQIICPGGTTRVTGGAGANPNTPGTFRDFISGVTFCAARGADRWQEFHANNGDLIDWKLGNNPIDPTEKVGTWSAQNGNDAAVTHTYGATAYTWAVCRVGVTSSYTLVSNTAGTITGVTIRAGQVPCP